jgi:hypothetical protein
MRLAEDVKSEEEQSAKQQCSQHNPKYPAKPLSSVKDPVPPMVAV